MAKITENEIEEAVEELMEAVDDHDYASPDVPMSVSKSFFEMLISELQLRLSALKESAGEDEEGEDDDDG